MSSCQHNGFVLFLGSWKRHYQVLEITSTFDFNRIISFVIYLSLRVLLLSLLTLTRSRERFFFQPFFS